MKYTRANILTTTLIVLSIAVVGYLMFFFGSSNSNQASQPAAASGAVFLPNGASLDTKSFDDKRYQVLIQPQYPRVSAGELGNQNPFITTADNQSLANIQITGGGSFGNSGSSSPFAGSAAVSNPPQPAPQAKGSAPSGPNPFAGSPAVSNPPKR